MAVGLALLLLVSYLAVFVHSASLPYWRRNPRKNVRNAYKNNARLRRTYAYDEYHDNYYYDSGDDPFDELVARNVYRQYIEAPGYLVKMNEPVFLEWLAVISALYTIDDDGKVMDGREEIENLRKALKEEAVQLVDRPRTTKVGWAKKQLKKQKWNIARAAVGQVPVVGHMLRLSLFALEQAPPAYRQATKTAMYWRRRRRMEKGMPGEGKYEELKDEDVNYEPFNLYIIEKAYPDSVCPFKIQ